jgi:hypothetical protein
MAQPLDTETQTPEPADRFVEMGAWEEEPGRVRSLGGDSNP